MRHVDSFHEGKKPFDCHFCDYSCAKKNMKKHVESVHDGKKPFVIKKIIIRNKKETI